MSGQENREVSPPGSKVLQEISVVGEKIEKVDQEQIDLPWPSCTRLLDPHNRARRKHVIMVQREPFTYKAEQDGIGFRKQDGG